MSHKYRGTVRVWLGIDVDTGDISADGVDDLLDYISRAVRGQSYGDLRSRVRDEIEQIDFLEDAEIKHEIVEMNQIVEHEVPVRLPGGFAPGGEER